MRARNHEGSVSLDKRSKVWNYYWWEHGTRKSKKIGSLREIPTKTAAWRSVKELRRSLDNQPQAVSTTVPTVNDLVVSYRAEQMPKRASTRRGYEVFLKNFILPKWRDAQIVELQPRVVQLWIESLPLAPKSKVHVRGLISALWDHGMWSGHIPTTRNPMELVQIRNASKRVSKPRTMTVEEFHRLSAQLTEPYRMMATLGACLGLRWSEIVGLQYQDIDWLNGELRLQRAVVKQIADEVKTVHSSKPLALDARILELLKQHKQNSTFTAPGDWCFASPTDGKLPRSYTSFWEKLGRACHDAGIVHVSPHSLRHSYRAWLDELGTPVSVQQRAMRHGDIRVTMSYGDTVGDALREASGKVAARAIPQ